MGKFITITAADGHTLSAWRSGPETAARGLVIVQEIFGVNGHIRSVCERYAAHGFAVIAPALFDRVERGIELGYGPEDIARGRALRAQVPDAGTVADIEGAATALGIGKLGVVGFCWGGTVAWWGATRTSRFAASVGWYGGGIAATRNETPSCPVQLHVGDQDTSIPVADVDAIRAAQPGVEIFVYPGAGHGFGCDERPSYNAADAKLAEERTLAFLNRHLGAA
jgi:carboxymethylenebutenolidase